MSKFCSNSVQSLTNAKERARTKAGKAYFAVGSGDPWGRREKSCGGCGTADDATGRGCLDSWHGTLASGGARTTPPGLSCSVTRRSRSDGDGSRPSRPAARDELAGGAPAAKGENVSSKLVVGRGNRSRRSGLAAGWTGARGLG